MTVGVRVLSNICKAYITTNMSELIFAHPNWKPNGSVIDRKIKVDMEANYQLGEFREFCHTLGYRIESGLPRASTKGNPYGYLCGSPGPGILLG